MMPGEVHLADHLDDAGTADARDVEVLGGRGEAGLVAPQVAADHLEAGLERVAVDAHSLDGAGRGALAAAELRALERRAGGAGGGELAMLVADDDLGVGADVDEQLHGGGAVRALGEDDRRGVGADVAGDARCQVHLRVAERAVRCRAPASSMASAVASVNGAWPSGVGSMPATMWCMIGLPTSTISSTVVDRRLGLGAQLADQLVQAPRARRR